MPILKNPKHEAFCQARMSGKNLGESYIEAGFKGLKNARQNAHDLSKKAYITSRMAELQAELNAAKLVAVVQFEITAENIARMLIEDRAFAIECGQAGAATQATMGLAKIGGLLVDQASVSVHHTYSTMSEEEIRFEIAALVAEARALKPGVQN